ncbi:AraC family transcriptional regulator [Novosphingobium sp. P6W]|uniref:AraC family transcriptional regulator n=1 Tax=Novosphingobium sp. P6W TaxID=1609758 RepID=UPI0005C3195F|nr:AraC family transcriptional regulator [Novosphingobium sp. P6W]AXB78897.1 AraC family transcriptional regulator [Novosphingobium sp. P6W]KIS29578.1 AraC family transcriptional regulator [Novosphingobium sp. P6W]
MANPADLIGELLTALRLNGVRYHRIQTGPRFGFGFRGQPGEVFFHYVAVGSVTLRMTDGSLHRIDAGQAVFLPRGSDHALLSDSEVAVRDVESFDAAQLGDAVRNVDTCPSSDPVPGIVLFHGRMTLDLGGMHGLGPLMPALMVVDAAEQRAPDLALILQAMKTEICAGRIGFAAMLARLADVAAAMIIRAWIEHGCDDASGLIAALRDPRLSRAILALHRDPRRNWSVAELAAECNVSRSAFAERFHATIALTPLRYATEMKMGLARQWLAQERLAIDTVADRLGYTSQAAFSRAFKRVTGQSPGASRRAQA